MEKKTGNNISVLMPAVITVILFLALGTAEIRSNITKQKNIMREQNEVLIRQLFDQFRRGDREQAVTLFSGDAVFSYPGPGPLNGDWRGREGIISFWSEQDRCSGGEFRPELIDLVAGDRNVFLLVRISQSQSGPWTRVVVYEVLNGQIVNARVYEDDPFVAEAFFSKEGKMTTDIK
jgi:uncharacterized protein